MAGRASITVFTLTIACVQRDPPPVDAGHDGSQSNPFRDVSAQRADVAAAPDAFVAADALSDITADIAEPLAPCGSGLRRCRGACVDTQRSLAHCGDCDQACAAAPHARAECVAGRCRVACEEAYGDCDGDPANGCEASLRTADHCGACGLRCGEPTPFCELAAGAPRCADGCLGSSSLRCDMECVDPQSSTLHCGGCGRECPTPQNARAVCDQGVCGFSCDRTAHLCGERCVFNDDPATCGDRCEPCPRPFQTRSTCDRGVCGVQCSPGWSDCDGDPANGCEVESRTSLEHCGACGTRCASGAHGRAACAEGRCSLACESNYSNCDGELSNGCESSLFADSSCGHCAWTCEGSNLCVRGVCAACSALTPDEGGGAEVADDAPLRLAATSFTVEAWLFATGFSNRCQHAIASKREVSSASGWLFSVTGADCDVPARRLYFQVGAGADPHAIAGVEAPVGRWFHAAASYELASRTLTLWQDGQRVGSAVIPSPSASATAPLMIGNDSGAQPFTWRGHLDDLRIATVTRYTAPFTPAPFAQSEAGTIALWRFQLSAGIDVAAGPRGYVAFMRGARQSSHSMFCRR